MLILPGYPRLKTSAGVLKERIPFAALSMVAWLQTHAAQNVGLAWSPSPGASAGYALYYGTNSGTYDHRLDCGKELTNVVDGLKEGSTYYFAVVACDPNGAESPPSNEVTCALPVVLEDGPPTLRELGNLVIDENSGAQAVHLSGITSGIGKTVPVNITARSKNEELIPNVSINYTNTRRTGSLNFIPAQNSYGYAVITVTVDNGKANNNTMTRLLRVTVRPTLAQLHLGSTIVKAGRMGKVPLKFTCSSGMLGIDLQLQIDPERLSNLSLTALAPEVDPAATYVFSAARGVWVIHVQAQPGALLVGRDPVAQLVFTARPGQPSGFVPLNPVSFSSTPPDGPLLSNRPAIAGRVVIVGEEPLIEAQLENGARTICLYGDAAANYRLEFTTNLAPPVLWTPITSGVFATDLKAVLPVHTEAEQVFYRVR